jgi:hypothetical protein
MTPLWLIGILSALFLGLCLRQYRAQKSVYRPLSGRQPERRDTGEVPLGMEAIDLNHIRATTRRNDSLERGTTSWMASNGGLLAGSADTDIDPLSDDETYAARYHAAFQKDKTKD